MKFGHRNDPAGYAVALEEFDSHLSEIADNLKKDDLLIITADHGCDPTCLENTDHSREYVPILVYGPSLKCGIDIGVRDSFADIGKSVADFFGIADFLKVGASFLELVIRKIPPLP